MIARKGALMILGVSASAVVQMGSAALERTNTRRDETIKRKARRNPQQFNKFREITIEIDTKKAHEEQAVLRRAVNRSRYSILIFYSKQVIYLPPFPRGNGGYQGQ